MKIAKLYGLILIIFALAALAAYVTESLSSINLTLFGFLGSTLFFAGLVALLPYLMNKHYESKQVIRTVKKK